MLSLLNNRATGSAPAPDGAAAAAPAERDDRLVWSAVLYGRTMPGLALAASRVAVAERCRSQPAAVESPISSLPAHDDE